MVTPTDANPSITVTPSATATAAGHPEPTNTSQASLATTSTTPGRLISVLENSDLYNVKHPLQYVWSLWLKKPDSGKEGSSGHGGSNAGLSSMEIWKKQVEHIGDMKTVEDFWCVVNNIPGVSQLQNQSDYFFFRDGIAPMWEDEKNVGGGMFAVTIGSPSSGGRATGGVKVDWEGLWLNSLMAAIGCAVGHHAVINGINFGRRTRGDRVQIWMGPTTEEQRHEIEKDLVAALTAGMPPQMNQAWYLKFSPFSSSGGDHGGHGRRDSARRESRGGHHHQGGHGGQH